MIVADTNAVVALFLPTDCSVQAEAWWRQDANWAAPPLLFSELCNVLMGEVRRGNIELATAAAIADEAARRVRWLARPSNGAVLTAAHAGGLTAYDAEFVAAADAAGCQLLTADRAILRAYPGLCYRLGDSPPASR